MPDQREIHRQAHAIDNPYDEAPRRISAYTAQEISTLQARLDKQLGPEYISKRQGQGGGQVHYIAGEKVINLANEVFGFNGWSSSIQQVQVDFVDENPNNGRVDLGLSVIVRVTLRDGMYHEDIGYGRIENCKGKGMAFEKAKKEGVTDGLKRALRNFGKVLGNCLYDKEYLQRVSKLKVTPGRWNESDLHRQADQVPLKKEVGGDATGPARNRIRSDRSAVSIVTERSATDDDYGNDLFEEMDFTHTDEVAMDISTGEEEATSIQTPSRPPGRVQSASELAKATARPPVQPQRQMMRPGEDSMRPPPNIQNGPARLQSNAQSNGQPGTTNGQQPPQANTANVQRPPYPNGRPTAPLGPTTAPQKALGDGAPKLLEGIDLNNLPPEGQGFMAGRALLDNVPRPFDPAAESPSIRRTAGVDMSKTHAVKRQDIGLPPPPELKGAPATKPMLPNPARGTTNFVNPAADPMRKVGMPGAPQSPMTNRAAFKAPSAIKRSAPQEAPRPPLTEKTNVPAVADGPGDAKKAKMEVTAPQQPPEAVKT